ncbi:MAG: DUF1838 family protein [Lysobacterales bacterium]
MFTLLFTIMAFSTAAEDLTLTGNDAFIAMQKTTCGTVEPGVTRYGFFEGRAYSRVLGEKDRHMFNLMGVNVRQCRVDKDATRGRSFRSVSREIMVYMDPATGEVIDTWDNPWTGETIKVLHVANDPVNMRGPRFEFEEDGSSNLSMKLRRYGEVTARSSEIPLFYTNPLGGDYQPYVGGTYHAMEIFDSFYNSKRLLNNRTKSLGQSHLGWVRVAKWLPWLKMGDRPGWMIFNATGFSTFERDELPEQLVKIMDERYPEYWTPPPLDDSRPNETSWTVFKKYIEDNPNASEGDTH